MKYEITGRDIITGKERTLQLEAPNVLAAQKFSRTLGIVSYQVRATSEESPQFDDITSEIDLEPPVPRNAPHDPFESPPPTNSKAGNGYLTVIAIAAIGLFVISRCDNSDRKSTQFPLSSEEHRAADILQNRLGGTREESENAARRLKQMLDRDRQRGR